MRRATVVMVLGCAAAFAQRPVFEVASVKVWQPGVPVRVAGGPGSSDPGRWTCAGCSLKTMLTHAYRLWEYQITGPDWIQSVRFDVLAKVPPDATADQFHAMQQALLEDRFKMVGGMLFDKLFEHKALFLRKFCWSHSHHR